MAGARVCAALAALLCACASHDFYRAYREAHPGWEPGFPRASYTLAELLAVIHAPPAGRNTTAVVTHLRVLGLGTDPWEDVPLAALRAGGFTPDPGRLYVVAANAECLWTMQSHSLGGHSRRTNRSFVWYVLRDDRLLAYDHIAFVERCGISETAKGTLRTLEGFEDRLQELLAERPGG